MYVKLPVWSCKKALANDIRDLCFAAASADWRWTVRVRGRRGGFSAGTARSQRVPLSFFLTMWATP
jgi:hypothetical protein